VADFVSTSGNPSDSPTAVHEPVERHDNPHSSVQLSFVVTGGDSGRHVLPDSVSTSGAVLSKDVG
jgi:hypothetical protein